MNLEPLFEITIERLGIYGEGVGYVEGYTVFVEGALPKERLLVSFTEKKKRFGRASIQKILEPSPHRVNPPCPLFKKCGGCQLMHLSYAEQLKAKRERVIDSLERIGKIKDTLVLPTLPSPLPLAYRNKIQLPVKEGKIGLYAFNTHDLIEIKTCLIHCSLGNRVFEGIRELFLNSFRESDLKTLLIKTAVSTEEVLVILVSETEKPLSSFAAEVMKITPEIKGVVQNVNPLNTNVILGPTFTLLEGVGAIHETLCGLTFKVSPASFFQVNPLQAEKLYQTTLEFAELKGDETTLDAYCGVGTLSLLFASHVKEVIGIECVERAVLDAEENSIINGIENTRFLTGVAEELIDSLEALDLALLNPPRKGCAPSFLEKLSSLHPKKIVYISCDPATLARDSALLISKGYQLIKVQPLDMFPQTTHVESVALFHL